MQGVLEKLVLPVVVVCIGLSAGSGYLSVNSYLSTIGQASGASPLPLPFYDIQGKQENFAYLGTIEYETSMGASEPLPLRTVDLQGPHRRIITYATALHVWSQLTPISAAVLVKGFCGQDLQLLSEPFEASILSVTLTLIHGNNAVPLTQSAKIRCPR